MITCKSMATPAKPSQKEAKRPATRKPEPAPKVKSFDIANSEDVLELANDLARFIKENKLSTEVQGKNFVNVEGWQYAGSRLGIVPITGHVINTSTADEIKYQAQVTLFDLRHQCTVGAGFATCSNKESGKKFYQEFAIMSMAQTRATGKAFRNVLAYLIRAAGYEATPAEEMEYNTNVPAAAHAQPVTDADRAQTSAAEVETPKKETAGAGVPVSAPPAASTTADLSSEDFEKVQHLRARFDASLSTAELVELWNGDAKPFRKYLLVDKEAAKKRIDAAVLHDAKNPVMQIVPDSITEPSERDTLIPWLTPAQKEQIIRLINHPVVTRPEKTKILLHINRLTEAPFEHPEGTVINSKNRVSGDAPAIITKVSGWIEERENGKKQGVRGALKKYLEDNKHAIGKPDCARLSVVAYSPAATDEDLSDALLEAKQLAAVPVNTEATEAPAA
ncbi:hypothetical protein Q5H92_26440 [Hymenobacter sp. M29]|uniref:ERF superfamily protein n=1 Tax=Hymenobacter mellowenesis TaxID=3063995 RepID=A0ABT9AJ75_9BACT|nr:hypothetical protein [Hymenobacter sp. M29]MDO7849926.1 hypothetical protein [Hymenobacter sp. M29]